MIWLWLSLLFVASTAAGWSLGRMTASRLWDR